ncbi:MAG: tetratricopeptide repeat protein [Gemmatimonadota bacterium]
MRRLGRWFLILAAGLAAVAGLWGSGGRMAVRAETAVTARSAASERALREREIAFYERRVERDPESAFDHARLASQYLQRARETGEYQDYRRAEAMARRSLLLRTPHNGGAYLQLAASLLAQHRFVDALDVAEVLVAREPEQAHHRALLGEIQLELGKYDEADATFATLGGERRNLAVLPRLARWAEIHGRTEEARRVLAVARDEADRRSDLAREQVAWFHLRVVDLELRNGRLEAAGKALEVGLAIAPDDPRLLAAGARLRALDGDWQGALEWGRRAIAIVPDMATVALVGDAWAALGDSSRAEAAYADVERLARETSEPYARQWTLFRLEHGRELASTRSILEREIVDRPDVYGWDQLAWARYLTGDLAGAQTAIAEALRMGTRDGTLFLHAGIIERALGNRSAARVNLERAVALNPRFHPTAQHVARLALKELEEEEFEEE